MKKNLIAVILCLFVSNTWVCAQNKPAPDEVFKSLFVNVQMQRVFPDSKTFVDAVPKRLPEAILKDYDKEKKKSNFSLKAFVVKNFSLSETNSPHYQSDGSEDVVTHIDTLWSVLKRQPDKDVKGSSLLPLPNAYIIPGGRFKEVYYWDTYFTMLGLQVSKKYDLMENIIQNFDNMLKQYGHIPNGNRSYYLSRSQPPYFSMMLDLLAAKKGDVVYKDYQEALLIEYNYWMDRTAATQHVVRLADGSILNRYWDQNETPRQESFYEDSTLAIGAVDRTHLYRELRSGAESGWDFSTRWFADGQNLKTINVTDVLPIDLNCLLYHLEKTLSKSYTLTGDEKQSEAFAKLAQNRLIAINNYFYNPVDGWYYDYLISEKPYLPKKQSQV